MAKKKAKAPKKAKAKPKPKPKKKLTRAKRAKMPKAGQLSKALTAPQLDTLWRCAHAGWIEAVHDYAEGMVTAAVVVMGANDEGAVIHMTVFESLRLMKLIEKRKASAAGQVWGISQAGRDLLRIGGSEALRTRDGKARHAVRAVQSALQKT